MLVLFLFVFSFHNDTVSACFYGYFVGGKLLHVKDHLQANYRVVVCLKVRVSWT